MKDKVSHLNTCELGLEAQRAELADRLARLLPQEGIHPCAIPRVGLLRFDSPTQPMPSVHEPCLCIVAQGRKLARLGRDTYRYDPLHYLVVSMSLPMLGQVIEATPEKPYLCLHISIDTAMLGELQRQLPPGAAAASLSPGGNDRALYVSRTHPPLLDAVLRLVRLLDTPEEAEILGPLVLREIHYRTLTGELGYRLRQLNVLDGHSQRVARAIELLKRRYHEPLRIEALAEVAHMSSSSLHQRFKAATAMSPLQYQKQLRLQEARRLMLTEHLEASAAAHRVGYESPSQFTREYRRLFGAPPRRDVLAAQQQGERGSSRAADA